jgi:hypothetical protein
MEKKHTPGRWIVSECDEATKEEERVGYEINSEGGSWLADVRIGFPKYEPERGIANDVEAKANAYLIAAAPELLEALEEIENLKAISELPEHLHAFIKAMKIIAKKAISKAKGL